ncbi:hypothetical protein GGS20DRAFT_208917 [Poronia punctata]|nr:hypothetical protein GGS20DRAFT_208917 [Poronia punctata]
MPSPCPPPDQENKASCVPPIPVPTYGPGGVFSVICSGTISAPPLTCLEKVLDLNGYPTWNTFVPSATITSPAPTSNPVTGPEDLRALASKPGYAVPGAKLQFNVTMTPGGSSRAIALEVTFLEALEASEGNGKGYRVAWKSIGTPTFLLRTERVQEFIELLGDDGKVKTQYTCWETFGGALGYVMPRAQIEAGFTRWRDGLKKAVEEETDQLS